MIVRANKGYETNSAYPNTDWYNDGRTLYVVDETTTEERVLAEKIIKAYPFYDFVTDENDKLINIIEYPSIQYSVDKTTITNAEIATITIIEPAIVLAEIDGEEYEVSDGEIEYSNENPGRHITTLKAEGYRHTFIIIEVVEA